MQRAIHSLLAGAPIADSSLTARDRLLYSGHCVGTQRVTAAHQTPDAIPQRRSDRRSSWGFRAAPAVARPATDAGPPCPWVC